MTLEQLLESLGESLSKIHESFQQFIETETKHQQSTESYREQQRKIDPNPEVRLPIEIPEYYRAEQSERTEKTRRERIRIGVDIGGFVLAIIIAVLTVLTLFVFYCQLKESQSQTEIFRKQANQAVTDAITTHGQTDTQIRDAKEQFSIERRPYLWQESGVDTKKSNVQVLVGNKPGMPEMSIGIQIQNFGLSPAIITRVTGDVELGGKEDFLKQLSAHRWKKYASIMPPGRVDSFEVGTKETILPNSTVVVSLDGSVGALFRFQYTDTEGRPFESDICIYSPQGIARTFDYCPADLRLTRLIDCKNEVCEK